MYRALPQLPRVCATRTANVRDPRWGLRGQKNIAGLQASSRRRASQASKYLLAPRASPNTAVLLAERAIRLQDERLLHDRGEEKPCQARTLPEDQYLPFDRDREKTLLE